MLNACLIHGVGGNAEPGQRARILNDVSAQMRNPAKDYARRDCATVA
jgi:hypothetical protein